MDNWHFGMMRQKQALEEALGGLRIPARLQIHIDHFIVLIK